MKISIAIKEVVMVRIRPDILGRLCPRAVLENTGLTRAGIEAPKVRIKNDVGQNR